MSDDVERGMTTDEYVLESLTEIEGHLKRLTEATRPGEIVGAASSYLASWPRDRIEKLQKIDGGWGTFDYNQRPHPIHGVADIARISNALGRHCLALKDAGIAPTPELLELDLYFALAKQVAENFISARPNPAMASARRPSYRHWSDSDAAAA